MSDWDPPSEFDGYRVVRPLGRGGMGRVFLGHDTLLDRDVAIKFIANSDAGPEWRQRFLTEGRAVARLSHPTWSRCTAWARSAVIRYLITEYVDGETLAQISKPVPTEHLVRVAIGLARGLAAAHEQGVLHRDLKPTNAMLTRAGESKLLDFGVAKLFHEGGPVSEELAAPDTDGNGAELSWTVSFNSPVGRALGTPMYMAPEVRAGAPASRRSDVFSFGAVLYELRTGTRYLLEDGTFVPRAKARQKAPPGRESSLEAVIDRCLEVDPLAALCLRSRAAGGAGEPGCLGEGARPADGEPLPWLEPVRGRAPLALLRPGVGFRIADCAGPPGVAGGGRGRLGSGQVLAVPSGTPPGDRGGTARRRAVVDGRTPRSGPTAFDRSCGGAVPVPGPGRGRSRDVVPGGGACARAGAETVASCPPARRARAVRGSGGGALHPGGTRRGRAIQRAAAVAHSERDGHPAHHLCPERFRFSPRDLAGIRGSRFARAAPHRTTHPGATEEHHRRSSAAGRGALRVRAARRGSGQRRGVLGRWATPSFSSH